MVQRSCRSIWDGCRSDSGNDYSDSDYGGTAWHHDLVVPDISYCRFPVFTGGTFDGSTDSSHFDGCGKKHDSDDPAASDSGGPFGSCDDWLFCMGNCRRFDFDLHCIRRNRRSNLLGLSVDAPPWKIGSNFFRESVSKSTIVAMVGNT